MSSTISPPPDGDQNRGYQILVPATLLFIFLTLAVAARLYVRLRIRPKLGWDDYTIFAAFLITCFGLACAVLQVNYGIGRHRYYLSPEQIVEARKWGQLGELQFIPAVALVKVSICLFLLRILDRTHQNFRRFIWFLMAVSIAGNIALFIVWFLQCRPVKALWDLTVQSKCLSGAAVVNVAYVQSAFNLLTDIICALFPIFFFHNSHVQKRMKGVLIFLASLGLLTSLAALLKIVYLPDLARSVDVTWALVNVTICALVEQYASVFLTCLPALKPLYNKALNLAQSVRTGNKSSERLWVKIDTPRDDPQQGASASDSIIPLQRVITKTTET